MPNIQQISGMNFNYAHYPFNYFLDSMVNLGIRNIEIWGASPHLYVNDLNLNDVKKIKNEIDIRNLNVICFTPEQCVYPINLAAKEDFIRKRSIKYFRKSLEVSCELESPLLLVTPGWGYRNEPKKEAWLRCKDSLHILTKEAEKFDIKLVLEPLRTQESNLINTSHSLKRMLEDIDSSYLKPMLDTIPMVLSKENINTYLEIFKEDLEHIHFIDGNPNGHLAWGDGILPLNDYLKTLEDYNYNGYMTLEITDRNYFIKPENAIKKSMKQIRKYIK